MQPRTKLLEPRVQAQRMLTQVALDLYICLDKSSLTFTFKVSLM